MVLSYKGFPGGSDSKEHACNAGDLGLIPGLGRSPGGGHGYPHQYSCLENPHGQRSLAGYSPWGHKESDTTEWLSTAQHCLADLIYFFFSLENVFLKSFQTSMHFIYPFHHWWTARLPPTPCFPKWSSSEQTYSVTIMDSCERYIYILYKGVGIPFLWEYL